MRNNQIYNAIIITTQAIIVVNVHPIDNHIII